MLKMNGTTFNFQGNSLDDTGVVVASMSANYFGQGLNFSLSIQDLAKDSAVVDADFLAFKAQVKETVNNMQSEDAEK